MNGGLQQSLNYPTPQSPASIFDAAVLLQPGEGEDFLCGICRNICNKPMDIGCKESHVFCQLCLDKYMQENIEKATCISCNDKSFIINEKNIIYNKFAEKQINKLRVQCPYSYMVQRKEKLGNKDNDNNNNDNNNDDNTQRPYDEGENIHDTQIEKYCEWNGIFGDILNHINNECKYKPIYNMIHCNYYKFGCKQLIKEDDINKHLEENKLQHLELKINDQFNSIINKQNQKIEEMQNKIDIQSKALELSKYSYLALTSDGVLTAFNINTNTSFKILMKQQKRSKTARRLCKFKKLAINSKIFASLSNVHHNLHILYKFSTAGNNNTAYCLESGELRTLPPFTEPGTCWSSICSKKYGLLEIGGVDMEKQKPLKRIIYLADINDNIDEKKQEIDDIESKRKEKITEKYSFEWIKLTDMKTGRYYPAVCEIEDKYLLICGGDSNKKCLDLCELYDYHNGTWKTLSNLKVPRRSAGMCWWREKNSIIIGGGFDNKAYLRKAEIYDIGKDKWMKINDMRHGHAGGPNISIHYDFCNNGVICIAGVLSEGFQDKIECYDTRDSKQKWFDICDIGQRCGYSKDSLDYNNRPLHSVFSI